MSNTLPLEEQVIAALRRITRAIDLHSRLLLQKNGLTIPQLAALQGIQRLQPITVGALARDIHLGPATVTGILGRLENRGLVNRTRGDLDRRSVVIELTDDGVTVSGEKKTEATEEREGYTRSERSFGSFQRFIPIPVKIQGEKATAEFQHGVLTVRLPKAPEEQAKRKKITIKTEKPE